MYLKAASLSDLQSPLRSVPLNACSLSAENLWPLWNPPRVLVQFTPQSCNDGTAHGDDVDMRSRSSGSRGVSSRRISTSLAARHVEGTRADCAHRDPDSAAGRRSRR